MQASSGNFKTKEKLGMTGTSSFVLEVIYSVPHYWIQSKSRQLRRLFSRKVKKKSCNLGGNRTHDLRIGSTVTLSTELRGRTEKVGDD